MMNENKFDEVMANPVASWALTIVSGGLLVAAVAWFSYSMFATRALDVAPRIVNSIMLEPTILLPGHPFKAHINVTLNRLCPYEVHWSLVRKSDGVEAVKIIEPVRQPPTALGQQDLPVSDRYIPSSTSPGEYQYVSEVFDLCSDGHTYISVRKNVDITIR